MRLRLGQKCESLKPGCRTPAWSFWELLYLKEFPMWECAETVRPSCNPAANPSFGTKSQVGSGLWSTPMPRTLGAGIGELGIRIDLKILQLSGFFGNKNTKKHGDGSNFKTQKPQMALSIFSINHPFLGVTNFDPSPKSSGSFLNPPAQRSRGPHPEPPSGHSKYSHDALLVYWDSGTGTAWNGKLEGCISWVFQLPSDL